MEGTASNSGRRTQKHTKPDREHTDMSWFTRWSDPVPTMPYSRRLTGGRCARMAEIYLGLVDRDDMVGKDARPAPGRRRVRVHREATKPVGVPDRGLGRSASGHIMCYPNRQVSLLSTGGRMHREMRSPRATRMLVFRHLHTMNMFSAIAQCC